MHQPVGFLMRIMSEFGNMFLAGYTTAIRIVVFTILPAWGISNAAATLVGQNLGAKQPERAEQSVWRTGFFNMLFMGFVMILFFTIPEQLIHLITRDEAVVKEAFYVYAYCVWVIAYGYEMVLAKRNKRSQ
ncbi:MAG: hypothetical protein IPL12_09535 [Bacteroidetes bacterium]|nr:hypothetical protein [Bacteroidota bacterium]